MMHTSLYLHHVSVGVTLPQESRIGCKVLLLGYDETEKDEALRERWLTCAGTVSLQVAGLPYRCQNAAAPDE